MKKVALPYDTEVRPHAPVRIWFRAGDSFGEVAYPARAASLISQNGVEEITPRGFSAGDLPSMMLDDFYAEDSGDGDGQAGA